MWNLEFCFGGPSFLSPHPIPHFVIVLVRYLGTMIGGNRNKTFATQVLLFSFTFSSFAQDKFRPCTMAVN